ncbi:MAG: conjugal transfer protein TraX [Blautia sp.]|nr:conjugal transfer protein TraX [Blautia sp.]MCM1202459.1 conjugal transfer protein TraX [Bacteroides fragilis]
MEKRKNGGFNGNQIKLTAILAMTLDHITWTLWPGYSTKWHVVLFHVLGRLTAPVMWFFIAEGYYHTRNVKKYAARLFVLAFVSHFAYNFCFGIPFVPFRTSVFNQTGVVWPLAWGLVLLYVVRQSDWKPWRIRLFIIAACLITFPADWSCIAALAVFFIGMNRGDFRKQMLWMMIWTGMYAAVYFFFIDRLYGIIQLGVCLTIPLLARYNGERGSVKWMGKLFYVYYPAHLVLCGILRILLWGAGSCTGTANFQK